MFSLKVLEMKVHLLSTYLLACLLLIATAKPSSLDEYSATTPEPNKLTTKRVFRTVKAKDSQSTVKSSSKISNIQKNINEAVLNLETHVTEMEDPKKYDDHVLISDVTVLSKLVLGSLQGNPVADHPNMKFIVSQIQTKIDEMTKTGKFDQTVIGDFNAVDLPSR